MFSHRRPAASIRLPTLLLILGVVPILALGVLAWRLLQLDRELDEQQLKERLNGAAALVARELDSRFSAWDRLLQADTLSVDGLHTSTMLEFTAGVRG